MLITCQTPIHFGEDHNAAMDSRLRKYTFKALPNVDPAAIVWLENHPMDCIHWAAMQTSGLPKSTRVDTTQSLAGELEEREKTELFMFNPNEELVVDPPGSPLQEVLCDETGEAASTDNESELDFNDDPDIRNLRSALQLCSPGTLRKRQLTSMLQAQIRDKNDQIERERQLYVLRQESLIESGVSEEHAALLPTDSADPLPSPIQRDLQATREQALRKEISAKRQRAREAFQEPWLQATERELNECNITLTSVIDRQRRTSMESYLEVLQDKIKNHHCNLGTLGCEIALEERRRWCCAEGLLKKEDRHLVISMFQTLPTDTELGESSQQAEKASSQQPPFEGQRNSDDEDLMFVTPVPRTLADKPKTPSYEPSSEPLYMVTPPFTPRREASEDEEEEMFVTPKTPSYTPRTKRPSKRPRLSQSQLSKGQTKVTSYFGSQKSPKK